MFWNKKKAPADLEASRHVATETPETIVEDTQSRLQRLSGQVEPTGDVLTRRENHLTSKGRYELDPVTRQLTPAGKTARLKRRLLLTNITLIILIILTYLILFFL